jgi:polyisoprenoid-binding protein YceI
VTGTWDAATIHGELTLHGQTAPQDLTLNRVGRVGNDQWRVSGEVVQSRFGIKPFTAFLGALKVKDEVRFEVVAAFGEASGS